MIQDIIAILVQSLLWTQQRSAHKVIIVLQEQNFQQDAQMDSTTHLLVHTRSLIVNLALLVLIVLSMIVFQEHVLRVIFVLKRHLSQLHAGKELTIQNLARVSPVIVYLVLKDHSVMSVVSPTMRIIFALLATIVKTKSNFLTLSHVLRELIEMLQEHQTIHTIAGVALKVISVTKVPSSQLLATQAITAQ